MLKFILKLTKRFSLGIKYLIAVLIIAIPLYPKFPFINIPFTYVSIRLEDFLLLSVAIYLSILLIKEMRLILKNNIERAILLSILIGFFSLTSAIIITRTVMPSIAILHWVRRIEYFIPFFAGLYLFRHKNPELIEFYTKLLIMITFIVFIYGFGQKYFSWPVIITQNAEYSKGIALRWIPGSHINSTFAGHYDMASFLIIIIPLLVCILVKINNLKTRVIVILAILASGWLLSNAISRISTVAVLMSTVISLLIIREYKAIVAILIAGLIFLSLSSGLRSRYLRIFEVIVKQISAQELNIVLTPTPIPVFEDRSTSIRLNVEWPRAIRAFSKNPLLGTGYSSITLATDNDYLRLLGEVGLLGFASFGLIIIQILKLIIPVYKNVGKKIYSNMETIFLAGYFGSFLGILLNAFFIDVFEASKFAIIFWLLSGFAVNMVRSYQNE